MKGKVSFNYARVLTLFAILSVIILLLTPFSTQNVSAQDDVGVGVQPVRPRITEVQLEHNFGTHYLSFVIFDLNSWRHVSEVSVEFYRGDDLVRHYLFNQTEDLDRSIQVLKGDGLVDFESHSSDKRETVDQRCNLTLEFQFSGINYDRITIRARDHAGGTSESTINFHGVTTGIPMTNYLLPVIILVTGAIVYKSIKSTGGEIDGA